MSAESDSAAGRDALRLEWVAAAPHRLFFFLGSLLLALASLWWGLVLLLRPFGIALPSVTAPTFVHASAMLYTFLPFYMFGFLFTAGPAWLGVKGPGARELLPTALVAFAAAVALVLLPSISLRGAGAAALLLAATWMMFLWKFARLLRQSTAPDRRHATLVLVFMLPGVAGLAAYAWLCLANDPRWFNWVVVAGVWCYVLPVFLTVVHRMLPFFTASALPSLEIWRPYWILWCFLGAALFHGALELAGLGRYIWSVDAPASLFVLWLALRWGLAQSLRIRLLAMLHIGFVWLGVAYALYAVSELLAASGARGLGLAPLHAVTMGFAASVLFAMLTRVSRGHSGRSLVADDASWRLYWLLQCATVLRIAAELWFQAYAWLLIAAMLAWIAAFAGWGWIHMPFYLRPRADGKPG